MKPLELYTINKIASRRIRPGSFELAFAGDNLGIKTGDTVTVSKDGVTAAFKLGRLVHFGSVGGGSLCNDKTESHYVFEARIVKTSFYVVKALIGNEPVYTLPGVYLTPAAAFAGVEQVKALSNEPEHTFGVFEVAPSTKAWHLAQRVLSAAEQAGPREVTIYELNGPNLHELANRAGLRSRQARRRNLLAAKPEIITDFLAGSPSAVLLIDPAKCTHDHIHHIGVLFERYPFGSLIKWTTEPVTEAFDQEAEAVLARRLRGEQVRQEAYTPIFLWSLEAEQRIAEAERMPEGWEYFSPRDNVWEQMGWRTDAEQRELEELDGTAGD